jgi:hypothetical protein
MTEKERKVAQAQREEEYLRARRRAMGNMQFVGHLYKAAMTTEKLVHTCMQVLHCKTCLGTPRVKRWNVHASCSPLQAPICKCVLVPLLSVIVLQLQLPPSITDMNRLGLGPGVHAHYCAFAIVLTIGQYRTNHANADATCGVEQQSMITAA